MRTQFVWASTVLLAASSCSCVRAQTELARPYRMSAKAQDTTERLTSLTSLEGSEWQYHAGPLAHGEDPALPTAGWTTIHIPITEPGDELWLRRWVEVPQALRGYDLTGARVDFGIDVGGDGPGRGYLREAIYVDGQRVQEGLHLDLLPLSLQAKPGARALVAVHMPATAEHKHFERVHLNITPAKGRPTPGLLGDELAAAAQLLPVLTTDAAALGAQEKVLESAAALVDWSALDRGDQRAFDASLHEAEAALSTLRPVLQKGLITLTGNAHIDAAWLWTASETVDQVHFTFANALQMMQENPNYIFTQSSVQYYEWMEQKFPELFAEMQRQVKAGRWEPVGGMWVEPDLNMPDGESEVRQLLLGKRYLQEKFGVDVRVGWNPDSFGFNWQLPQIYKKSGIDYFLTQKLHYNDKNLLPLKLFWWQSPDGSRVLTYFPHDYVQNVEPVGMAKDLAQAMLLNPGATEMMHLYGPSLGRLALNAARAEVVSGELWSGAQRAFPRVEFRTAQSFFEDAAKVMARDNLPVWNYSTFGAGVTELPASAPGTTAVPVWNDELYLEHHRGTYTTQAAQKANMRHSEQWLVDAEKFATLGWLTGAPYPAAAFTAAWKRKSFDDFHDSAAGTGIAQIYRDAQADYDTIHWTADEARRTGQEALLNHIDTGARPGTPIVVWNSLSWDRTDVAEVELQIPEATDTPVHMLDSTGQSVLLQALPPSGTGARRFLIEPPKVPSLGYTVLQAIAGEGDAATDLHVEGTTLENAHVRVAVDPKTGCITHLIEKRTHFDSIASGTCGNLLQAFEDKAPVEDAWNIEADFDQHGVDLVAADRVEVVERGPVRAVVRVTRRWSKSTVVQDITLYANLPRVDVVSRVDWHETQTLLKAGFKLASSGPHATYEIPFGSIERPTTRNNASERERFEVPAIRWADLGDEQHGFSLMNESKFGYDAKDNQLRLSLLRAPTYPDPEADRGVQRFTYSLLPHAGSWKRADTVLRAWELNAKLTAQQVPPHSGDLPPTHSFMQVEPHNLVVTALKKSEDDDSLVLRFYEWAGKSTQARITVPAGLTLASETNLMEQPTADTQVLLHGNSFELAVQPFSINTLRLQFTHAGAGFWKGAQ